MTPQIRSAIAQAVRWGTRRQDRAFLAGWWGVSPSRASHKTTALDNEVARVAGMIADPKSDGASLLAMFMAVFEHRCEREAKADRAACEARLAALLSREHDREAAQNRALQNGGQANDAILAHVADLLEIATRRTTLGLEA